MNPFNKVHSSLPLYSYKSFLHPTEKEKENTIATCLRYNKNHSVRMKKMYTGYNFEVPNIGFLEKLSSKLKTTLNNLFGEYHQEQIENVFCYASNEKFKFDLWHDHTHTGTTLVSVYYLNLPKNNETGIQFQYGDTEILDYYPEEGELILFPHYLMHRPYKSGSSEEWRISINIDRKLAAPEAALNKMENYNETN